MTDLWPDAEVGELISDGTVLSFEAAGAITKGKAVYLSADMKVSQCSAATQYAIGIALKTVALGEFCPVCIAGVVKATAGGTSHEVLEFKQMQTRTSSLWLMVQELTRRPNCPTELRGLWVLRCRRLLTVTLGSF